MTSETMNTFKAELEKQMLKDYVFERIIFTAHILYGPYIIWLYYEAYII